MRAEETHARAGNTDERGDYFYLLLHASKLSVDNVVIFRCLQKRQQSQPAAAHVAAERFPSVSGKPAPVPAFSLR